MTDKATLDAAFGPVEKARGRPAIRPEPTRVVSVKIARSIVQEAHERRLNRGLLTRWLTACYILLIERPTHEFEEFLEAFEWRRGATIEQMTVKELLTHAGQSTTTRATRPRRIRTVVVVGTGGVPAHVPQGD